MSIQIEDLHKIPFSLREHLYEKLSRRIRKDKQDAINRKEKALTRYMVKEWTDRANKAVSSALSVIKAGDQSEKVTKKQANTMIDRISKEFKGYEDTVAKKFEKDSQSIYKINKIRFVTKFKLEPKKKQLFFEFYSNITTPTLKMVKSVSDPTRIYKAASFGTVDEQIWEKISHLGLLSAGERYPRDLLPNVQQIITEDVFASGLSKEKANEKLTRELTRLLGSRITNADPEDVAEGLERTSQYFKGLTGTNTSFLRNFSQTTALQEAGIKSYQIVAIIDRLTSQICTQLNGRIFSLSYAIKQMNSILDAESIEDVKLAAPWRKDLSEFDLSAGEKLSEPSAAEVLGKAGMALPPYHWRCRTEIEPV